ncbi:nuclear transport factor 2 family protein [Nocardioides humilatus]|uniref:Nuclear transport factor 2 family protein n=1 Tax=Nocardioides humilatus TaxID=2607660 RepID=A0A5B1LQM6_9ACTN|nr:nuclear transport factor 2 family protein [Nocardioides humilatus]KAA1421907.1 nuclear transport factor 2 family protein [Nocardioides humilatus]
MSVEPRQVVETFYEAAKNRDGEALVALIDTSFREDAAVEWPAGLPYGGRVEGAAVLRKVFAGLATPDPSFGPDGLNVLTVVEDGDHVAVQVSFAFRANGSAIDSGALELWTFTDGLVAEVKAYYWDTAACQALLQTATA